MRLRTLLVTGFALLLPTVAVSAQDCSSPASGPDVIVGVLPSVGNFGGTGGVGGYSLGTTSCNVGSEVLSWVASTNQHPVIAQNFYMLDNGRFEQIGMSWLKHGFTALQGSVCCSCTPNPNGTALGVGCSDPYSASLNGSQGGLGPRSEVNPFTGAFLYPFGFQGASGNQIFKRAQIDNRDLNPSFHPTALYFGEGQYVSPDDAAWGNQSNNASYRPLLVTNFSNGSWNLATTGSTQRTKPALQAWSDNDPGVTFVVGKVPGEGRYFAASKATDNGDGTWHYEYAIQNLTSDVSIGSFSVPIPTGASVTNVGFHDVNYHSGEPWDGTDWVGQAVSGELRWATQTFAQDVNANAIRWGTVYNYWFDADVGPGIATSTVGYFKPHTPNSSGIQLDAPVSDDPWEDLAGGTTGVAGQPALSMSGSLTPSSLLSLDMLDAAPLELALIFISFSSTPTPISFLGGTLHPFPWDVLLFNSTDVAGELHGSFTFSGATSGQELWFQVAVSDASVQDHGASLSNGVKGTVP